jgi:hypothetical protein
MLLITENQVANMDKGKSAGVHAWMAKPFARSQQVKTVDKNVHVSGMVICCDETTATLNLKAYRTWLTAALAATKTDSRSSDFSVRKSANHRADNLVSAIALLDEYAVFATSSEAR